MNGLLISIKKLICGADCYDGIEKDFCYSISPVRLSSRGSGQGNGDSRGLSFKGYGAACIRLTAFEAVNEKVGSSWFSGGAVVVVCTGTLN